MQCSLVSNQNEGCEYKFNTTFVSESANMTPTEFELYTKAHFEKRAILLMSIKHKKKLTSSSYIKYETYKYLKLFFSFENSIWKSLIEEYEKYFCLFL